MQLCVRRSDFDMRCYDRPLLELFIATNKKLFFHQERTNRIHNTLSDSVYIKDVRPGQIQTFLQIFGKDDFRFQISRPHLYQDQDQDKIRTDITS